MQIFAIRHGLSQANQEGVIQGHSDCSLSEPGIAQAELLGRYFKREGILPDVIYTSPLQRAHHTAKLISKNLGDRPDVIPVNGLMEINVGELSGVSMEQALGRYPDGWSGDINKWLDFSRAGGESFDDFFGRVSDTISELTANWHFLSEKTIFFVAHAGVLRPLIKTLLATDSDMMFFTFGNCCHVRMAYREVSGGIRRVMSDLVTIETVAQLMGVEIKQEKARDSVGEKMG